MGAPHDGKADNDDKAPCPADEGYIMSGSVVLTDNIFKWSYCSIQYIQDFLRYELQGFQIAIFFFSN